jgi:DNA-binding FrmR family transcriptional regulator
MTTTLTGIRPRASVDEGAAPRRRNDPISNRLRRAAGQLTGVQKMYEHGRRPGELLDQLAAARAALDAVAVLIIDQQAEACTGQATTGGQEHAITELTGTIRRYLRSR